jgi:hypothetical protein
MRILLLGFSLVFISAGSVPAVSAEAAATFGQGSGDPTELAQPGRAGLDEVQQSQAQDAATPPSDDAKVESAQAVNADELGVSIDRIRLRFERGSFFNSVFDPRKLKLTAYVDVVGKAPAIRLFGFDTRTVKEELTSQAVPYGAPSHGEIVRMLTPQEFRTPPMDLTAIINWLAQQLQNKEEK